MKNTLYSFSIFKSSKYSSKLFKFFSSINLAILLLHSSSISVLTNAPLKKPILPISSLKSFNPNFFNPSNAKTSISKSDSFSLSPMSSTPISVYSFLFPPRLLWTLNILELYLSFIGKSVSLSLVSTTLAIGTVISGLRTKIRPLLSKNLYISSSLRVLELWLKVS